MPLNPFPGLYVILDMQAVEARGLDLLGVARSLRKAGVRLIQYRDKSKDRETVLRKARLIREVFSDTDTVLILNDHAELVLASAFDGVHLGQNDCSPQDARVLLGSAAVIGQSTHTLAQARAAEEQESVDYVAVGPIFLTSTKLDSEPIVGLDGLRAIRECVSKPVVAIGGISEVTMPEVAAAGANSVAVIGALFSPPRSVEEQARRLIAQSLRALRS